jgi:hypothetical protein
MVIPVFVGYEPREQDAFQACIRSLKARSSVPLYIKALDQSALRRAGLYRRSPNPGQWTDSEDAEPFSTAFGYTRFLIPALMQWKGWALFCDCDFLFRADIAEVWRLRDAEYAVQVVKHNHRPEESRKMDDREQVAYPRKNWSSLCLWNCGHESNLKLTVDEVNLRPKRWLHSFSWLKNEEIGALPAEWNWLEGSSEGEPKAVHYTRGIPSFAGYQNAAYADEWRSYLGD